ncbi:Zinc finger, RING-type [Corchorus capsularis]|uniref:RBR-type E3 ubiquitin transferase n=1 Tax=Corchorus capsularis TaxID=210143 RepID=A0A1R3HJM7_COCAP|nr:Zinc finger, RING-type [Corchorus capsularis]
MAKGEGSYDDYDLAEEVFWSSGVLEYGNEGGDSQQLDAYFAQQLQFQDALFLSVKENIHSSESEPRESESSLSYCQICLETKERNLMFPISGCSHSFCSDCITMHVKTRLEESTTRIMCPGENCRVVLGLEPCRPLLPKEVVSLWDDLLCQKLVRETGGPIIYCPFKDCSAPFSNESQEIIKESECLSCNRLFCAQCHVPWHVGIDCEEFQKLNEDERGREDIMLRNLAKENKWIKCPSCHMMVEKTEGCIHMTCRCKFEFCYRCGAEWSEDHQGGYDINLSEVLDGSEGEDLEEKYHIQLQLAAIILTESLPPSTSSTKSAEIVGESSRSYCQICLETKERNLMFPISGCSHSFCFDCISEHVKTRLKENTTRIMCPGENCRVMLGLEPFRSLLPKEVISLWDDLLCQKLVRETGGPIIYCPFKDCSAPFSNENQEIIKETECLSCNRLFCAHCHVPWHVGIECEEYQKLNEDERGTEDIMLRNLAKENKWIKCPSCHMMVEKTEGCIHMTCRCKFEFCYKCGADWSEDHFGAGCN